jgi:hypothetical protein
MALTKEFKAALLQGRAKFYPDKDVEGGAIAPFDGIAFIADIEKKEMTITFLQGKLPISIQVMPSLNSFMKGSGIMSGEIKFKVKDDE